MSPRRDNWTGHLNAYLEARRSMPFAWGVHDCCMFAAEGVQAVVVMDHASGFRGRYKTSRGAANILRRFRGDVANIPPAMGLERIPVGLASRGDVVCHPFDGRNALGLCCGLQSAFAAANGLVFVETLACTAAWRI
jgi:hypothetical protein